MSPVKLALAESPDPESTTTPCSRHTQQLLLLLLLPIAASDCAHHRRVNAHPVGILVVGWGGGRGAWRGGQGGGNEGRAVLLHHVDVQQLSSGIRLKKKQWELNAKFLHSLQFKESHKCVVDSDPGSGAFLTPGSGIRNRFIPDPGSQTHIFKSLVTIFWVKKFYNSLKTGQIFFFSIPKLK